jgi:hypothetical protein
MIEMIVNAITDITVCAGVIAVLVVVYQMYKESKDE